MCPTVAASQCLSLRTTTSIKRGMQKLSRRRVKTHAALPNEGTVLRIFSDLWVSGRFKLRRFRGYRDTGGTQEAAA